MSFLSVLFDRHDAQGAESLPVPACFRDLNLDQIVASITEGRDEYGLPIFFYQHLTDADAILYRQEVFHDLEDRALFLHIGTFALAMQGVRKCVAQSRELRHRYQKARWLLDAVIAYCGAASRLDHDLRSTTLHSRALSAFAQYLGSYLQSAAFLDLKTGAERVCDGLESIHYDIYVSGGRVEVMRYEAGSDYADEVREVFKKFEQAEVENYAFKFYQRPELNHIEASVLDRVALLYPNAFEDLASFTTANEDFLDSVLWRFDQEIQFYVSYLEYVQGLRAENLPFCYPEVSEDSHLIYATEMFDVALAQKLFKARGRVVTNDVDIETPERVIIVSGANQGGKSTFARAFGQLHYFACLGCPVPARRARLMLFDELFTHFEREEAVGSLAGKLEDELLRMHDILSRVTARSLLIMNETFGATTLSDAQLLGKAVLLQVIERGTLCVCVTFIEELASLDAATVSMVSTVDPKDPAIRTFKIVRRSADGNAHALAIAKKYRLSYDDLRERIRR